MTLPIKLFGILQYALFNVVLLLLFSLCLLAQNSEPPRLPADIAREDKTIQLDKLSWKYRAGDDAAWAAKDYDEADWKNITNEQINNDPSFALGDWNGRAWFRLRIQVDEELANQPLAWRMWHWGASEIYLDGKLIQSFGAIEPNADSEFNPRGVFFPVVFASGGEHTIAVRYSLKAASDLTKGNGNWLARGNFMPGFILNVGAGKDAAFKVERRALDNSLDYVFIGLLCALALVHFLLFAFYPRARGNLYYSFFVAGLGATIAFNRLINDSHFAVTTVAVMDVFRQAVQAAAIMSLLAFLYFEFMGGRVSRFFWVLIGLWAVGVALLVTHTSLPFPYFLAMLLVTLADSVRIIVLSLARRQPGAWNIAAGVGVLVVGVALNVGFERDMFLLPEWLHDLNLNITILSVPVAVSIYLARNFARTNKNLETQLVREVEHEKERARLEIVEAENERRAKELEEARQLQLSMLPKKLPELPNLEIAAYMKPATEVGGDYYDFYLSENGTLTVAVGDATGHGLKAGSVVTATKSLFNAFAGEENIGEILTRTGAALKKMNLRGLFMAMTMLKIKGDNLALCTAGMPAALIYRGATKQVEEIAIKALPLGSVAKFPYKQYETLLSAGDCVVVMSDGFPEMFNEKDEILGFDIATATLPEIAGESAQTIINRFVAIGESWANGRPQDDDVTFVVLKVKTTVDS
jgi:serine phosphatase RsbU (regulator of sigma subunit)